MGWIKCGCATDSIDDDPDSQTTARAMLELPLLSPSLANIPANLLCNFEDKPDGPAMSKSTSQGATLIIVTTKSPLCLMSNAGTTLSGATQLVGKQADSALDYRMINLKGNNCTWSAPKNEDQPLWNHIVSPITFASAWNSFNGSFEGIMAQPF